MDSNRHRSENDLMTPQGALFSLRRNQTGDGPGLRTVLFFKGCPLRCAWCHNPESFSMEQEVWWQADLCIGCGRCAEVCPEKAVLADNGMIQIDRDTCTGCAACVEVCPSKAMEALRTAWTVDDLFNTIHRDRAFLMNGGGVTVSGGEPALQWPFVSKLLARCRKEGFHTALDTCGAVCQEVFEALLPHCDLVLFDLKLMDGESHRKWTGQSHEVLLENLELAARHGRSVEGAKLWIRTPLIPGATATTENITAIGTFIKENLSGIVERWELCAFNNLCADKYRRLGKPWSLEGVPLLLRSEGETLLNAALSGSGLSIESVFLKGRMSLAVR